MDAAYVPKFPSQSIAHTAYSWSSHITTFRRNIGDRVKDFPHFTTISHVRKNDVRVPCHIYTEQKVSPRHLMIATAWEDKPNGNSILAADEYGVSLLGDGSFGFGAEAAEFITIWWHHLCVYVPFER